MNECAVIHFCQGIGGLLRGAALRLNLENSRRDLGRE
jgi:hypothetical protein